MRRDMQHHETISDGHVPNMRRPNQLTKVRAVEISRQDVCLLNFVTIRCGDVVI